MSSTYSEIYTTNLRNQSMILKGEKTKKPSSTYVTLIKNFTKRHRVSSLPKSKFKPRRINSKSVQNQIPNNKKKSNTKKKTKSKQKLEKSQKEKNNKEKDKQKQKERNEINNNNKNSYRINNYISKSTDLKQERSNNIKLQKINEKEIINNFFSDINNNTYNNNNKNNNNNNNDYCLHNTLQNKNNNNIYNNFNNYVKLSKTSYDNSFNNYFDIFRLRRNAANFRDIMTNSLSESKSKNGLSPIYNINKTNKYLNTITDFNPKKSKALFEAKRLKEKINKFNNNNNNFNQYLLPHPGYNLKNNENNIFEELLDTNNNSNQNEIDKENINNVDNNKNNDNNNNDIKNITYHFFDRNIKMPKRIKKYINDSNVKLNYTTKNMNRDNYDNNSNQQDIKFISQNIKNSFRKNSKYLLNHSNNFKSFKDDLKFNNLNCCFSPNIYRNKFKYDIKKNINLNLITQENAKLNSLLKKIPSSREFKDKSYELMNYILKLRKHKSKNNFLNMTNNTNFQCIYPVNECDLFSQIKNDYLC